MIIWSKRGRRGGVVGRVGDHCKTDDRGTLVNKIECVNLLLYYKQKDTE